ncbi:hypothetical protein UG53_02800, partial [Vibrio sp. S512-13]
PIVIHLSAKVSGNVQQNAARRCVPSNVLKNVSTKSNIQLAIMPMVLGTVILRSASGMGALSKPCLSVAWLYGLFFSSMSNIYLVGKLQ